MTQPRARSWYTATLNQEGNYPELTHNLRVDVAVVGAGLTGVNAALELSERGYKVALLEANCIGWGATGRNGGQVTGSLSGDKAILKQLSRSMGDEAASYVWQQRWRGQDIISRRVAKYDIQCDLKKGHLHTAYKPSHLAQFQRTYNEACRRGMADEVKLLDADSVKNYIGTSIYHGGLYNTRNLHLHSLNLCLGEAAAAADNGVEIFENTPVVRIHHHKTPTIETTKGQITANTVLLAGNAYHRLERRKLAGLLFPASLANMATEPLEESVANAINPLDLAVYDSRFVLDYYRLTPDRRLMFGGGTNYSGNDPANIEASLRPAMEKTFPQLKGVGVDFQWTGMAGITINRIPQLGRLSAQVYYAQGYSGHGIASSHISAEIIADAIDGSMSEFDRWSALEQIRLPLGDRGGQWLLTLGMLYYTTAEKFS